MDITSTNPGLLWIGLIPFISLFTVLVFTKRSLVTASAVFLVVSAILATLVWQVFPHVLLGAVTKGLLVSLDIVLIITGALFFLDILKKLRIISSLEHYLHELAPDSRIQALLLAWFFGGLLEGTAGFGAPPAIIAPLLAHLGFSPITAATIALLANTAPVSFGAAGTPLRVGMANIVDQSPIFAWVLGVGAILCLLVPVLVAKLIERDLPKKEGVIGPHGSSHSLDTIDSSKPSSIMPFALWSGFAFGIPYLLSYPLGPVFPSILGGAGGICLTVLAAQSPIWRRIFFPNITQRLKPHDPNILPLHLWRVILPYALLVICFALGRNHLPSTVIHLPGGLSHTLTSFNPGLIFIALAAGFALHGRLTAAEITHSITHIGLRIARTAAVVTCVVAATQILTNSGQNTLGLPSMLTALQMLISRENALIISPLIGALGGFIAGSTTLSNLIFADVQWQAAGVIGTSGLLLACLQMFGATTGNALSLSNISAIESALKLPSGSSRKIVYRLVGYLAVYMGALILITVVASIFLHGTCGTDITTCGL